MNRDKQSGMIEIVLALAFVGLCLGAYFFYKTAVAGYKTEIAANGQLLKDKQVAIDKLAVEVAEAQAKASSCTIANGGLSSQVTKQNQALLAAVKERDDATAQWRAAEAKSAKESVAYKQKIAGILAAGPLKGEQWFESWSRMLNDYYKARRMP